MAEAIDHREVGRQLASIEGVNLDSAPPGTLRLWDARSAVRRAQGHGVRLARLGCQAGWNRR
ncbi:hypothetical protein DBR20_17990 [Stenotrophomonas sp. HMWF023]|nr:hypothetical protein DBR20_17990 [Stenotrophomonas sp. HMWF023]